MFLSNFIIGGFEDNIGGIIYGTLFKIFGMDFVKYIGYPYSYTFSLENLNQPFIWIFYYFFSFRINSILFQNVLILLTLFLILVTSYFFYKKIFASSFLAISLALVLTFSPYNYYQLQTHIDLAQLWLPILIIFLYLHWQSSKNTVYIGLLLAFLAGISNYLTYFTLVTLTLYSLLSVVISFLLKEKYIGKFLRSYVVMLIVFLVFSATFLLPYYKNIVTSNQSLDSAPALRNVSRDLDDFVTFTSRPWYLFLPSIDNPLLGIYTKKALNYLQNDWKYFLSYNYFASEHSASYLGLFNIILLIPGYFYLLRRLLTKTITTTEKNALVLGITGLLLITLTLPPYFTISGVTLYTPSYLLWKVLPMFRVLSRLGIFVLLTNLLVVGYGLKWIFISFQKNNYWWHKIGMSITLFVYLIFSLTEFYIPVKITNAVSIPKVYRYLATQIPANSPIAVYPYSKTTQALFWLKDYRKPLVNPRDFVTPDQSFNSEEFTKDLVTAEGIADARMLGVKYIVLFPTGLRDSELSAFRTNLKEVASFHESSNLRNSWWEKFVKYNDTNASYDAIVYEIR